MSREILEFVPQMNTSEDAKTKDIEAKMPEVAVTSEASGKTEDRTYGCNHYRRKCKLVCPTCDKSYTCRFCHDDKETHEFNRYEVKEVVCLLCSDRQPVSPSCRKCSVVFGKYYCSICNLYNDEDRHQYHCHGCGLCRVGPAENFFHCPTCDMCFPTKLKGKHKCIERASRCPCAVCLEDIHTARTASHIPPCGHLIHQPCFEKLIQTAHYTCPICNTSMIDMKLVWQYFDGEIQKTPMPKEYARTSASILCRDCHEFSTVKFHFYGLKCGSCGGYNTCIDKMRKDSIAGESEESTSANNNNNNMLSAVASTSGTSGPNVSSESMDEENIPLLGEAGTSETEVAGSSSTT